MLHHVSVGVGNVERAVEFYDAVLGVLGYRRVMELLPHAVAYGERAPEFWILRPADKGAATAGNGAHVAFAAASKLAVDAFHRIALSRGGTDEGPPGPRPEYSPNCYGAFVRDPYGNKLEATVIVGVAAQSASPSKTPTKTKPKAKKPAARASARTHAARKPPGRKSPARRAKGKGRKR